MVPVILLVVSSIAFFTACEPTKHADLKSQREAFSKMDANQMTVRFIPRVDGKVPVEFRFVKPAERFPIGETIQVWAHLTNLSKQTVLLTFDQQFEPATAAPHVSLSDCFCSNPMTLLPKQEVNVSFKLKVSDRFDLTEDIIYSHFLAVGKVAGEQDKQTGH